MGATPLFARHSVEWDTDFLFKKSWTLSSKVEFMVGVGPEWIRAKSYGVDHERAGRESGSGLYVLAIRGTQIRLVS